MISNRREDETITHPADRPYGAPVVKCRCTRTMTPVYEQGRNNYRCGCGLEVNVAMTPDFRTDPNKCQVVVEGVRCGRAIIHKPKGDITRLGDIKPGLGLICDECALSLLHGWADDKEIREYFTRTTLRYELEYWRRIARKEWYDRDRQIEPESSVPVGHVVYYVRLGNDHVKIGTTGNLNRRMRELRVANKDNLLAVERGTYTLEKHRHQQFAAYKFPGWKEDFHESEELLAHIELLLNVTSSQVDKAA